MDYLWYGSRNKLSHSITSISIIVLMYLYQSHNIYILVIGTLEKGNCIFCNGELWVFNCWHYYKYPQIPCLCPPPPCPSPLFWPSLHCRLYPWASIYVIWLISSLSFIQSLPPFSLLTSVSLSHVSVPLFLFCSSVYCAH